MQLLLWQWSMSALTASVVMIAVFFGALWRSVGRAELRWWTYAWIAELGALGITLGFWYTGPAAGHYVPWFFFYTGFKTLYLWLLMRGALELLHVRPRGLTASLVLPSVLVFSFAGAFLARTLDLLGVGESVLLLVGLAGTAILLVRSRDRSLTWLALGFGARALLALFETVAYTADMAAAAQPNPPEFLTRLATMLAVHTSVDTGAEWLIALGCVIAVFERTQRELKASNERLLSAQSDLRRLADRDPLTALANRRALADVFRAVQPSGATIVFFDLDDFKKINDEHGHQAGDECLQRFARALVESFRPSDAVVRYAGDEFVVVAPGLDETSIRGRIDAVRARVRPDARGGVPVRFSYGVSQLPAGGHPESALRTADEAMYRVKPSAAASAAR